MAEEDDLYAILGVQPFASQHEIKSAFRQLALEFHPDKLQHLSEAQRKVLEARYRQIYAAYEVLADDGARQEFDRSRREAAAQQGIESALREIERVYLEGRFLEAIAQCERLHAKHADDELVRRVLAELLTGAASDSSDRNELKEAEGFLRRAIDVATDSAVRDRLRADLEMILDRQSTRSRSSHSAAPPPSPVGAPLPSPSSAPTTAGTGPPADPTMTSGVGAPIGGAVIIGIAVLGLVLAISALNKDRGNSFTAKVAQLPEVASNPASAVYSRERADRLPEPIKVVPPGRPPISLSAGTSHACAVKADGSPVCWGRNSGSFGNGRSGDATTPVSAGTGLTERVVSVSAGYYVTCWITATAAGYCSGRNNNGQLGIGTGLTNRQFGAPPAISGSADRDMPSEIEGELRFSTITVGHKHACGLTVEGTAYCWGENGSGQLGNGGGPDSAAPVPVATNTRFVSLSAGNAHTCGVAASATYCWGSSGYGELGNSSLGSSSVPVLVAATFKFTEVSTSVREAFTCGLAESGEAYCWGQNRYFRLGNTENGNNVPIAVAGNLRFEHLAVGSFHVCGLTADGAVFCWGSAGWGQLGGGYKRDSAVPLPVLNSPTLASITAGEFFNCGITREGSVHCWGSVVTKARMPFWLP